MLEQFERMDMVQLPKKQHLRFLLWMMSFPTLLRHRFSIKKTDMRGLKPPYIVLGNHNSFIDFRVAIASVFPYRTNFVAAINGFLGREKLLRLGGGICTRRFTADFRLVRKLRHVVKLRGIIVMYPEARYTLCGTPSIIPESTGKLIKLLKIPVVTLISHGVHVNSPFWDIGDRKVKGLTSDMTCILKPDQISDMTADEINDMLRRAFTYDDFQWQKDNNIKIPYENRANGLHRVLYQCPHCKTEYEMESFGHTLRCKACDKEWEMTELGELKATSGETEFGHIPDWYEWERQQVRAEVRAGSYSFRSPVRIDLLPNADGFVDLGEGTLTHDYNGLVLEGEYAGEKFTVKKPVPTLYSCQIEYNYRGSGNDCVGINTDSESFYVYPLCKNSSVTKISLAVEEMYAMDRQEKQKPC